MPAPQASEIKKNIRDKFTSFKIKVPQNWQNPSGDPDAKHYADAFTSSEKNTSPGSPPLVLAQTSNKYHTDTQKMHIDKLGKFFDGIGDAIASAWSAWQTSSSMVGVIIAGSMGNGGKIVPNTPWAPLILTAGPKDTPMYLKYTTTVANILGAQWLAYGLSITLAGASLWPMFNSFPSPVVPPPGIPNPKPCKLSDPTTINVDVGLQTEALKSAMIGAHADPQAPLHKEIFEAVAFGFNKSFQDWKKKTELKLLGMGAVPSCVPPAFPPGPVVGTAIMPPGMMV
jgi:hypothetical protein